VTARVLFSAVAAGLLLVSGGCDEWQQQQRPDVRATEQPDKYSRDRELCHAQVDEYMHQRRRVDDVSGDPQQGSPERVGQTGLETTMANYGDSRNADRAMASCMEQHGWPQPRPAWWQRIGS